MSRIALALAFAVSLGCTGERCAPGHMRTCSESFDGGGSASGYQTCQSSGRWSECVLVGACASEGGTALPAYSRCTGDGQCGPADCAACSHYTGVVNPQGYSLCEIFCVGDSDCVPPTPATGVTPSCILGQCALLCQASSFCPLDTQCLAFSDATIAAMYPTFTGLCE